MQKVVVMGSGTMGSGVAAVNAIAGHKVLLLPYRVFLNLSGGQASGGEQPITKMLDDNLARIKAEIDKGVKKGKFSKEEGLQIIDRIVGVTDISMIKDADWVIESVQEDMKVKHQVYSYLDEVCDEKTIFASNTSALSITELARGTKRPDRFLGLHFFNPPPAMPVVEVVKAATTSTETYVKAVELAISYGKKPITVNEAPGFVLNRVLMPLVNEAIFVLSEGVASAEDIDAVLKTVSGMPLGPLAMADYIGLDVLLAIMETLQSDLGDNKYRPCPLLRKMVRAGYTGKKAGRGFYTYA